MSRTMRLLLALTVSVCPLRRAQAQSVGDPNGDEMKVPTIELTKLDVNDTDLELSYKIRNNTDHDVWICDNVDIYTTFDFEAYLSEDEESLLIRRRLDVPTTWVWLSLPYGRYVLLRSGQERTETLSLDVPVQPRRVFASKLATSNHARRLVLEIGFYNEDLPGMIRGILEMAEKLNCARGGLGEYETPVFRRYFTGIWLSNGYFGRLSDFEKYTYEGGHEEIEIPYTWQNLGGEQVLRIEVNGVHIPYEEALRPSSRGQGSVPPKGRGCFLPETPVWVDGMIVPISKAVAGQAVRKALCAAAERWPGRVDTVQKHTGTFECRDIILESGNQIGVVGAHRFMLATGEWIAARDLRSGLRVRTHNGTIAIKSITTRREAYTGEVYNLKVTNSEMYMVGDDAVIVRDY